MKYYGALTGKRVGNLPEGCSTMKLGTSGPPIGARLIDDGLGMANVSSWLHSDSMAAPER